MKYSDKLDVPKFAELVSLGFNGGSGWSYSAARHKDDVVRAAYIEAVGHEPPQPRDHIHHLQFTYKGQTRGDAARAVLATCKVA